MCPSPLSKIKKGLTAALLISSVLSNGSVKAQERELHLEVFINGQPKKLVAKFKQNDEGKLFSEAKELREIGIKPPQGSKDNQSIALDGLKGVSYIYDQVTQTVKILAEEQSQETKIYLAEENGTEKEKTVEKRDLGAVVNYSMFSTASNSLNGTGTQFGGVSGSFDSRVFGTFGTVASSFMVGNATTLKRPDVVRLDTTWTYSSRDKMTVARAGDIISGGHSWTRPIRLGGIQLARNFNLRPDLIPTALPGVSGSAAVPSTVDVYVNNTKTYSQEVSSGPFRISNLPILGSTGTARVVVTEPNGRVTETTQNFLVNARILSKGNFDYSAEVGKPRLEFGVNSANYSTKMSALAATRYGLTNNLTLENQIEAADKFVNVGAGLVTSVLQKHLLTFAGQLSSFEGKTGANAYVSLESQWKNVFFSAAMQRSFGHYYDLAAVTAKQISYKFEQPFDPFAPPGLNPINNAFNAINQSLLPSKAMYRLTVGAPLKLINDSSISLSYIHTQTAENTRSHLINVTLNTNLMKDVSAYLSLFADRGDRRNYGFYSGLIIPIGKVDHSSYAALGVSSDQGGTYVTADYAKPLSHKIDSWGYRVRDVEGKASYRTAAVSYRSRYAKTELTASQSKNSAYALAYVEGAVAVAGGGVFLANRIDDSFAVVNTGSPNIEVFSENRLVGRTGSSGKILIPTLRSNESNRVTINPVDLPINATLETSKTIAIPADRGVSIVNFGVVSDPKAATVIFKLKNNQQIPAGTLGEVEGSEEPFIIGYDGRAFIKGLNSSNKVTVKVKGVTCNASFPYEPAAEKVIVIGPVLCE